MFHILAQVLGNVSWRAKLMEPVEEATAPKVRISVKNPAYGFPGASQSSQGRATVASDGQSFYISFLR